MCFFKNKNKEIIKKLEEENYTIRKTNTIINENNNMLKCEKLYWAIGMVITSPVYVEDSIGRKTTYCNVAAYDLFDSRAKLVWWVNVKVGSSLKKQYPMGNIIQAYDYDLGKIFPEENYEKILSSPIPYVFDEAIRSEKLGEVRLLTQKEAQEKANKGIPIMIISKKFNHVAIACPHLKWNRALGKMELFPYDSEKGCFTGNAGGENDYMYMSDKKGFGQLDWRSEEKIIYIQFRKYNGEFESGE